MYTVKLNGSGKMSKITDYLAITTNPELKDVK